jgi:hypothetical protein
MSRSSVAHLLVIFTVLALAASLLPGCAAKKAVPAAPASVMLEYRLAQGKPVTYRNTQSGNQTLEIMGQYMNILTKKDMTFTVVPGEITDGKQHLTVTVDSLDAGMSGPQGEFSAETGPDLGKSFDMHVTTTGREMDITGADVIKYGLGSAGERSIKPDFQSIFPDLAGRPVKIGDTWATQDTLDMDEGEMKIHVVSENVNTFEGIEIVAGMECARIGVISKGTVKGDGVQQGTPVVLDATSEGKDTWFFAHKSGMLARLISEVSMSGAVKVGGDQGMSIPMKQTMTTETEFVK